MDFKSLLNKLDSMEAPAKGIAAPELPKAVQLDEGAQLRVLSGQSTILAESALMEKAAKKDVKEGSRASTGSARDKLIGSISSRMKDTPQPERPPKDQEEADSRARMKRDQAAIANIGKKKDETSAKKMAKKEKEVDESIEGDLEEGWDDMVSELEEAVAEGFPTVADAKARAEKEKTTDKFDKKEIKPGVTQYTRKSSTFTDGSEDKPRNNKKDESVKEGKEEGEKKCPPMSQIKKMCQDKMSVAEICKKHPDCNQKELKQMIADCKSKLNEGSLPMTTVNGKKVPTFAVDGEGPNDKAKGKDTEADDSEDEPAGKKGMSDKQAKYFGKKAVKESVEGTLTFAKALQIIKESNGTAQIDPLDDNLWAWARRIAASKFNESVKADVYAATTYERMGGTWGIAQINE